MFEDTKDLVYHHPEKMTKEEILKAVKSENTSIVCNTLVATAFHEEDLDFCINLFVNHLNHVDHDVRVLAVLCFAHLARLHGRLPENIVIPIVLEALESDDFDMRGSGITVMDDLEEYIPPLWKKINDLHSKNSKNT